jgi:hypothetical protein
MTPQRGSHPVFRSFGFMSRWNPCLACAVIPQYMHLDYSLVNATPLRRITLENI